MESVLLVMVEIGVEMVVESERMSGKEQSIDDGRMEGVENTIK
jgi:hypothetical protein